ncbi:hypothetical protein N658DRAFT_491103 [Parathielavia hyrcaniae]|uniref:Uncharacterized protein n=1 Tax=Parathielavia hyrcaniae TaxID=113614 RepID=A0AAN6T609_9PEZI|nr:hypothetical protein N658DRAFT_491103 [Parathielavia hyrcaniae]
MAHSRVFARVSRFEVRLVVLRVEGEWSVDCLAPRHSSKPGELGRAWSCDAMLEGRDLTRRSSSQTHHDPMLV